MQRAGIHGGSKLKTNSLRFSVLVVATILFAIPTSAATKTSKGGRSEPEAVPGEFVVKLKKATGDQSVKAMSALLGVPVVERVQDDIVVVRRAEISSSSDLMRTLKKNPAIERVEPNFIYRFNRVPNDPGLIKLWGLRNAGGLDKDGTRGLANLDVGAERAWDITTGSKEVVVAVIDTGIDYKHPDLAANVWVNTLEKNGRPGVDDDGNGYVDDIHGYDFVNNDGDPMDDNGHGTHCSGTIGAAGNDGQGLVGVNWNVSIMGIKFLGAEGGGSLADAIKAINYASSMGVDIMSNSWGGGGYSEILKEAIVRAKRNGILFVAAAGNSAGDNDRYAEFPASYDLDNVISVAAIGNRGELAYFSNYGAKSVHVAAPGLNILSTVPGGVDVYSGTSMATPHVSGVAALLLARYPKMDYDEIKARLIRTSKPVAGLKGRVISGGAVDAFYALVDVAPPPDANDPSIWSKSKAEVIETPHPYIDGLTQTWTVRVPGAKRVAVHFTKFDTEAGYDQVQFFNASGDSLGSWSGRFENRFSPIADGDQLIFKLTSDDSVNAHGFSIDQVTFE